jgi:hypothetical protein
MLGGELGSCILAQVPWCELVAWKTLGSFGNFRFCWHWAPFLWRGGGPRWLIILLYVAGGLDGVHGGNLQVRERTGVKDIFGL